MSAFDGLMTVRRAALTGPRARRGVLLLVVAVLTVQFGLIQHVIDAGSQHADLTCEFCVAGDHHSSLVTTTDGHVPVHVAAPLKVLHPLVFPAGTASAAHRVRGPPRNA